MWLKTGKVNVFSYNGDWDKWSDVSYSSQEKKNPYKSGLCSPIYVLSEQQFLIMNCKYQILNLHSESPRELN